ncbi:hypothetical protein SH139x_001721 [Planctomycetaceae bacterium SH139]
MYMKRSHAQNLVVWPRFALRNPHAGALLCALACGLCGYFGLSGLAVGTAAMAQAIPTAAADEASPSGGGDEDLQRQVAELIERLDGSKLAIRQQAERDLLGLGPSILDFLPDSARALSAEASQRLRRVRLELELQQAKQAAGAKLISLGRADDLQAALKRISELTEIGFQTNGQFNPVLELDVSRSQTFWKTLDTVLDAAEADVNFYVGKAGELGIAQRAEGRPSRTDSAAYAGVYRLEPTRVMARRDLRSAQRSELSIGCEIAWEPRLTPIGLTLPLESVVAVCDDGQQLRADMGEITIAANASISSTEFNIPLPLPTDSPLRISTLSGTLRSMLPGAREHFKIDISKPHEAETVGNVTVLVEAVRANNHLHEVRLEVAFVEGGAALESHRQWIFDNPAYVTTASGERREVLGTETYRQTAERLGISFLFDLDEDPTGFTFHYETPVSIIQNEVQFVMRDIPLP